MNSNFKKEVEEVIIKFEEVFGREDVEDAQ